MKKIILMALPLILLLIPIGFSYNVIGSTIIMPTFNGSYGLGNASGVGANNQVTYWNGNTSLTGSNNLRWETANILNITGNQITSGAIYGWNASNIVNVSGGGTITDNNTVLLVHFDSSFNDSSVYNKNTTTQPASANATIDGSSFQFGNGSGRFFKVGNVVTSTLNDSAFNFSNTGGTWNDTNWTVEFWAMNLANQTGSSDIVTERAASGFSPFTIGQVIGTVGNAGRWTFSMSNGTVWNCNFVLIGGAQLNTWQHIVVEKSGDTVYTFLNGTPGLSCNTSTYVLMNATSAFRFGDISTAGNDWNGSMDELRVSRNITRYPIGGFTPPTAPFNTTLSSGINITSEVTIYNSSSSSVVGEYGILDIGDPRGRLDLNYGTNLIIADNNTEVARFDSNGRLGIGTTHPDSLLNIENSATGYHTDILVNGTATGNNGGTTITLADQNSILSERCYGNSASIPAALRNGCTIFMPDGTTNSLNIGHAGNAAANKINLYTNGSYASPQLTIALDGTVGINNSAPNATLAINGMEYVNATSHGVNIVTATSNSGILVRSTTTYPSIYLKTASSGGGQVIMGSGTNTWYEAVIGKQLTFYNDVLGGYAVYINDSGYIGVNTSNPLTGLHITGSGILVKGTLGQTTAVNPGTGIIFLVDVNDSSFTYGRYGGNQRNSTSRGTDSIAMGINSFANGSSAIAIGQAANSSGSNDVTLGTQNLAAATSSAVVGYLNNCTSSYCGTFGMQNNEGDNAGLYHFTFGFKNNINTTGQQVTVLGIQNNVTAGTGVTVGLQNNNAGTGSVVIGRNGNITGQNSMLFSVGTVLQNMSANAAISLMGGAVGINTTAPNYTLQVVGTFNQTSGNATYQGIYGGMWFDNDTGITMTIPNTFSNVDIFNLTSSSGVNLTQQHDNGIVQYGNYSLEVLISGIYQVHYSATGSGVNNHEYESYIAVNNVTQFNTYSHVIGQQSNQVQINGFGFINCSRLDNVTLQIRDVNGPSTGTIYASNVNIVRVGNQQ